MKLVNKFICIYNANGFPKKMLLNTKQKILVFPDNATPRMRPKRVEFIQLTQNQYCNVLLADYEHNQLMKDIIYKLGIWNYQYHIKYKNMVRILNEEINK